MRPVLKVCVPRILPVLSVLPACGMVILPAGPDAAAPDATPPDGPSPPDAVVLDAPPPPDAAPPPDVSPCTFALDFTTMDNQLSDTIVIGGLSLQGTFVTLSTGLGLGVAGDGFSPVHVDGSEELELIFDTPPGATGIRYTVADPTDANQDGVRGEHLVHAIFHPEGQDMKVLNGEGTIDLGAMFPSFDRVSRIVISARNQDGIRITELDYSLCEE